MGAYGICEECGRYDWVAEHHIIHRQRGRKKYKFDDWIDYPWNRKKLCVLCHTDQKRGVHHNKKKDLEYKKKLQAQLRKTFNKEYYTPEAIGKILKMPENIVERMVRFMPIYERGYNSEELIFHMMGDRFYD